MWLSFERRGITHSSASIPMLRSIMLRVPVASVVDVDEDTIVRTPRFPHAERKELTLSASRSRLTSRRCECFFRSRPECHNYHGELLPRRVRVRWGQYTKQYAMNSRGTQGSMPNFSSGLWYAI